MKTPEEIQACYNEAEKRFITAAGSNPPTNGQVSSVAHIKNATVELAALILEHVPDNRNRAIALTALEDVQMRANRGIFQQ